MARRGDKQTEVIGEVAVYGGRHKADLIREADPDTGVPVLHARVTNADTLDAWFKSGRIEPELYLGGADFRGDFHRAGLRGRYGCVNWHGLVGGGAGAELVDDATQAARNVAAARERMGPKQWSCAWFVLGEGLSLRAFALRMRVNGIAMTADRASGLLEAVLEQLAIFYRHKRR